MATIVFVNSYQIFAIFVVSLSMLNCGLQLGWTSPVIVILTSVEDENKLTSDEASYLCVIPPIIAIIVTLPVACMIGGIGRKKTLLLGTIPYFISWILTAIGSKWILYAARAFTGIGDACACGATSLYVGEIALPRVRGKWGNLLILNFLLGIFLAYVIGGYLDMKVTAYLCAMMPVVNFIMLCIIPESPYYLIMKKDYEAAKASLQWLRQRLDIDEEYVTISAAILRQMEETGSYKDIFFIQNNRKALIAVVILRLLQQFAGMSPFIVYAQTIFEQSGNALSPTISAIICGGIPLIFSMGGAIIIEKFGRRKTLFISAGSIIVVLTSLAVYFYLEFSKSVDIAAWDWFPLVGMIMFLIGYSIGMSMLPTLMSGELFSVSVKEKSMAINNIIFAVLIASTSKLFQVLSEFGLFVPFAFYACSSTIFAIACYFVIPETKGKTLDEIQQTLKSHNIGLTLRAPGSGSN